MEESSNRRSWEEEIYWQNFHFAQFSLTLPYDFHHHLKLPKKFTGNMSTKLPEQVTLKVNRVSWNVNLEKGKDDIKLQGDGWAEFVNAYSLKKKDILIFKYNRRECFEVLLFDGANLCEKEASYFVRKDHQEENSDDDNEEDRVHRRETKENLSKGHPVTPRKRSRKNHVGSLKRFNSPASCTRDGFDDRDETGKTSDEENSTSVEVRTFPKNAPTAREMRKRKRNAVKMSTPNNSSLFSPLCYKSNKRAVTELERNNAFEMAREAFLRFINPFMVVMRPSCVYKRFFMTIPAEWKPRSVLENGQDVILRVKDKTWVCKVRFCRQNSGVEGAGWKKFAFDNSLEVYDVCLFVPSNSKDGRYVLDVSIFRVDSHVVPS